MIALIQRCKVASVQIEGKEVSAIGAGMLILLGVSVDDTENEAIWLSKKAAALRIFSDDAGKMNLSLIDSGGQALVVSQFTLLADSTMGNRPSYTNAARPEKAKPLYELFVRELQTHIHQNVPTGIFGAEMQVRIVNDGPVTLWLESKK